MSEDKKILISSAIGETRMALLENDQVSEIRLFRDHTPSYVGVVYLGRVVKLSSEFQAAFIELEGGLTGFLPLKTLPKTPGKKPIDLTTLLHQGQRIIVQVTADAADDKSLKLTGRIELISTALVLHPFRSGAYVSSRIKDPVKREELKEFGSRLSLGDLGITFRTDAENLHTDQLTETAQTLISHWNLISKDIDKQKCPCLLTQGPEATEQIMRDYTSSSITEIIIDHASALKVASLWAKTFAPDLRDKISLFNGNQNLFSHFEVDDVFEQITSRHISLNSGAWITFEKTEAMVVIDVNMGHATIARDAEKQIFKVNREAAREIFRQLRLRGTGGIIIIDFINMTDKGHIKSLLHFIDELMLGDPMPVQRGNISALGLLELSRKARQQDLDTLLLKKYAPAESVPTQCLALLRDAEQDATENPGRATSIRVNKQQQKWFEDHSILFDQFEKRTHSLLKMDLI